MTPPCQCTGGGSKRERFAEFYDSVHEAAIRSVRMRTTGCDCEALVADALELCWRRLQTTGDLNRGWFYRVLKNKIGDYYRSSRRTEVSLDLLSLPGELAEEGRAGCDAAALDVCRVLFALPVAHREPLVLVYWCDLSGAGAARALGLQEGAFRVRLHRAKRAFRALYAAGP